MANLPKESVVKGVP